METRADWSLTRILFPGLHFSPTIFHPNMFHVIGRKIFVKKRSFWRIVVQRTQRKFSPRRTWRGRWPQPKQEDQPQSAQRTQRLGRGREFEEGGLGESRFLKGFPPVGANATKSRLSSCSSRCSSCPSFSVLSVSSVAKLLRPTFEFYHPNSQNVRDPLAERTLHRKRVLDG